VKKAHSGERLKCSSLPKSASHRMTPAIELTEAYLNFPSHLTPIDSMCMSPYRHILVLVYISNQRPPSIIRVRDAHYQR
jgi:hypothetical protein